ncbi:MAG: TIGR00730 family Rossman fold protein [Deltaproteobacteria bacterium]|nr:TIGR00730 family Rossman fold protein [Candidatus Deferrimicrobiaceae bacterium]
MRAKAGKLPGYRVTPEELLDELRETVEGLSEDGADRGDLKILARAMRELRHSFRIFAGLRGLRKVTVFGSARCRPDSPGYRQAVAFGGEMARRGWLVITGGGEGIMEAAHVGAGQEMAMGINILLPFEQPDNSVIAGDAKLIHVKYFFTRKLLFVKEADGVALFPGGFGTLDESFEVLTLLQTGKSRLFPIVLVDEPGGDYWRLWKEFVERHLLGRGWISREDLALFRVTDNAAEAAEEILGFYRVYHSMRYVGKDLVFRLRLPLADAALSHVQAEFGGILDSGRFRQGGVLPEEADEPELADLPRLVFRFNRKSFGRLRMLVDFINREAA